MTKIDLGLELYRTVGRCADTLGVDAYAVGGVVRDHFLGRPCTDIDIVCVRRNSNFQNRNSNVEIGKPPSIGIELAKMASEALGGSKVAVFKNFGTASFKVEGLELEFVGARRESYSHDSRNPIVEDGTLEDDQKRRDFTVNALAICLNADRYGELMDPFGGIGDMNEGVLRTPLDPDITFSDDPLRMMRAVRFASQLGFRIADDTFEAIGRNAHRIEIVSAERTTAELNKIMLSAHPTLGLKLMQKCGLMELILPEISALAGVETMEGRGHKDIFFHTMQVLDNLVESEKRKAESGERRAESGERRAENGERRAENGERRAENGERRAENGERRAENGERKTELPNSEVLSSQFSVLSSQLWLRWAALLHDVGKPGVKRYDPKQGWTFHGHEARGAHMVKRIFKRLRLPLGAEERYVEKLVMLHMRPIVLAEDVVTDSAVRRLLFEAGEDIDDLMMLCNADITTRNEEKQRKHRKNFELVKRKLVELEERDRIRNFQPPVSGQDIMETFGIGPCREIGTIKDAIKDAILDGKIANEREAAWGMMLELGHSLGLTAKGEV